MIIDFHTHIFPPQIIAERQRYLEQEAWFAQLYGDPRAAMSDAEGLLAEMERTGVDGAVACGFAWHSFDLCVAGNDYLAAAMQRYPGKIIGFANVPALHPRASEELRRCADLGLKGVGELMPDSQGFRLDDIDALTPLAETAQELGMPLLIHLSEPVGHSYPGKGSVSPDQGFRFAQAFSELTIIFAHWGGGLLFYELMPEVRAALVNVAYDCAASPYLYQPAIWRRALELVGPEKLLFGSDFPVLSPERYFRELEQAALTEPQMQAIAGGNAARILGLS